MTGLRIRGYSDIPSVAPGERVRFYVSCDDPGHYQARLVRLINGDLDPAGPGPLEHEVEQELNGEYPARHQRTQAGGYVEVPDPTGDLGFRTSFTVHAFISSMIPTWGRQGLVTRWDSEKSAGWALYIDDSGRLAFTVGDGSAGTAEVTSDRSLFPDTFYSVTAVYDAEERTLALHQTPVINSTNSRFGKVVPIDSTANVSAKVDVAPAAPAVPLVIAGFAEASAPDRTWVVNLFNGKIDSPAVYLGAASSSDVQALDSGAAVAHGSGGSRLERVAQWDFSAGTTPDGIPTDEVLDIAGSNLHGHCVNQPDRGMTGWNWEGREENFKHAPEQYGAIWFHEDSLDDSRWEVDFEAVIPENARSGCYAVKLTQGEAVDYIPFFVRPPRGTATSKVLFLVPTLSYLAYANTQVMQNAPSGQAVIGHVAVLEDTDLEINEHTNIYGLSTYDYHLDGRGCQYTSWRRPILNMRPRYRHEFGSVWQFPADLQLIDWLNALGYDVDVATDHDLVEEGPELFRRYNVVLTGTHPEYYTREMIDAWETYLAEGGRGMYLAGNGMYWITSVHPEKPWVAEIRKGESGDQAWRARPGELYHSTSGERGGLWRMRGRASAKVWGVVYTSHGLDVGTYFEQMSDAQEPRLAWMFEGIKEGERIGDFGLVGGGAAGLEVDRYDQLVGSPPNAYVVASSYGHSPNWGLVPEEQYFVSSGMNGPEHPSVRGDVVYFSTRNGGAMFSGSSMTWCASLSWNGYENNVARMTANVLNRFAADGPLEEV